MKKSYLSNCDDRSLAMGWQSVTTECVLFWQSLTIEEAARLCVSQCMSRLRCLQAGSLKTIYVVDSKAPVSECHVLRVALELASLKANPWPPASDSLVISIPWENLRTFVLTQESESASLDAELRVLAHLQCVSVLKKRLGIESLLNEKEVL